MTSGNTVPVTQPAVHCYICGRALSVIAQDKFTALPVCQYCYQVAQSEYVMQEAITKLYEKRRNDFPADYCDTCHFHLKACKCPKKKALDDIKK